MGKAQSPVTGLRRGDYFNLIDSWWLTNLAGITTNGDGLDQIAFANVASARPDEYCALTVQTTAITHGYATELDQLWTADGELIASAQQVIAVIK